ncbi:hypothetical protein PENTCL1PPCAC_23455 [Pristionchus entomophagus]|uniref:Uncharacterized protein n=1 Tax=Pristionchus entomophagus TaxID=358040 RepID=A0AAV5U480_9BILA|nr:hypothetical protein PENTCL1PPCAC_23455 [Pristionchus entomophagus]
MSTTSSPTGSSPQGGSSPSRADEINWQLPPLWQPLEIFFLPHPDYHAVAAPCIAHLFYGSGPLKKAERHFVALMTAAHHECQFLLDLHEREFEREGGEFHWLQGLKHMQNNPTEKKFRTLDRFVHLISHQPWRVNGEVLKSVFRDEEDVLWSLNQLVHAATIVAVTNALCAMVHGLGKIEPMSTTPLELSRRTLRAEWNAKEMKKSHTHNKEVDYLVSRMATLQQSRRDNEGSETGGEEEMAPPATPTDDMMAPFFSLTDGDENDSQDAHVNIFTAQGPLAYRDFAAREDPAKTYKIHEFDWDHAFNMLNDVDPLSADLFDKRFVLMQTLTYHTMGDYSNIDTSEYRLAIWNYIHALFGIRHDDYEYQKVNELLSRQMKTFVKTCVCFPERMTEELRNHVMPDFTSSERIHALLIIIEARCQANLLYFTRALNNYYVLQNADHKERRRH